jgi:hypothetical protein
MSQQTEEIECNHCGRVSHDRLFLTNRSGTKDFEEDYSISWGTTWEVFECRGCGRISVRQTSWNSEATDERGKPEDGVVFFPPRTFRKVPDWQTGAVFRSNCPAAILSLLAELYVCLQNECPIASAMVVRSIFERVMIATVKDQGTFAANLARFEEKDFITKKHREVIEPVLEAGHASIHRSFVPSQEDVVTLVDILEGILQLVYVHSPKARELHKKIPRRKKRKPTPAKSASNSSPPTSRP